MKQESIFKGTATALITPFDTDGSIDYDSLGRLIDFQISEKIDALVVCGTTGEAPSLTEEEQKEVIAFSVKKVTNSKFVTFFCQRFLIIFSTTLKSSGVVTFTLS